MNNKLILGTVQFGLNYGINNSEGKLNNELIFELLDFAYDNGISILDTAEAYGDAHDIIAKFHEKSDKRFEIITKYSKSKIKFPNKLLDRVNFHLDYFGISELYAYMFHSYNEFIDMMNSNRDEIIELVSSGKIKKLGVSVYSNEQLMEVMKFPEVGLLQLPFNLLDNEFQRGDILKKAKTHNMEIHTRSVFLQGLFFKDIESINTQLNEVKSYIEDIDTFTNNTAYSKSDISLAYPMSKSYIDKVLIGVDNKEQLINNIESIGKNYEDLSFDKIDNFRIKNIELSTWEK